MTWVMEKAQSQTKSPYKTTSLFLHSLSEHHSYTFSHPISTDIYKTNSLSFNFPHEKPNSQES